MTDGTWPMNNSPRLDLAIMGKIDWPVELGIFLDLDAVLAPDVTANIFCRYLDINAPLQDIGVGTHIFGQVAYVAPVAIGDIAIDGIAFSQHQREKLLAEVILLILLKICEYLRVQDIDTGIDGITEDFAPAWFFQELCNMPILVGDNHTVFEGIGDMGQRESCQRLFLLMIFDNIGQVVIRQGVTANNQEWLCQLFFRVLDAASSTQRHIFP